MTKTDYKSWFKAWCTMSVPKKPNAFKMRTSYYLCGGKLHRKLTEETACLVWISNTSKKSGPSSDMTQQKTDKYISSQKDPTYREVWLEITAFLPLLTQWSWEAFLAHKHSISPLLHILFQYHINYIHSLLSSCQCLKSVHSLKVINYYNVGNIRSLLEKAFWNQINPGTFCARCGTGTGFYGVAVWPIKSQEKIIRLLTTFRPRNKREICLTDPNNKKCVNQGQQKILSPLLLEWASIQRSLGISKLLLSVAFVINEEVRNVMPYITVVIQVSHGRLQRRLESVPMIFKEPQNYPPSHSSKDRERVLLGFWDITFLHCQSGQAKQNTRQQVHVYLAVDMIVFTKH